MDMFEPHTPTPNVSNSSLCAIFSAVLVSVIKGCYSYHFFSSIILICIFTQSVQKKNRYYFSQ